MINKFNGLIIIKKEHYNNSNIHIHIIIIIFSIISYQMQSLYRLRMSDLPSL